MSASSDRLGGLHELFTQFWENRMRQASDPNPEKCIPISAAELAVLRAFLKDNGVQADPTGDKDLEELSKNLREQTKGAVKENEFDSIMSEFNSMLGERTMQ